MTCLQQCIDLPSALLTSSSYLELYVAQHAQILNGFTEYIVCGFRSLLDPFLTVK